MFEKPGTAVKSAVTLLKCFQQMMALVSVTYVGLNFEDYARVHVIASLTE